MTDPASTTGEVLVVCVNSIPDSQLYDSSCTLFPGEHEFISRHSYVAYRFSKIVAATLLEQKVAAGEFIAKPPLSERRFADVVTGLLESPHTTLKVKRFFEAAK